MQKTFDTPSPVSLYVELGSGNVLVHTDETDRTTFDVTGEHAEDVVVEQRGEQIVVIAKQRRTGFFGSSQSLVIDVSMPHDSKLATKLGSADLRVTGRIGETVLRAGSGDIRLGELNGNGSVETGSGDVAVDRVAGPLQVKSGSGEVTVDRAEGPLNVSTGSGDVLVESAAEAVTVRSGSGDLRVRDSQRDVLLSTASGDLVVERMVRGQLTAKNVSGDITVGIPAGVPVWTDISCVTGSVHSSLEGAGEPQDGQDFVELRAKTVSGDIHLEQL
jgi:DUF4097 and DUF4098 domain-containing protein YvlB